MTTLAAKRSTLFHFTLAQARRGGAPSPTGLWIMGFSAAEIAQINAARA